MSLANALSAHEKRKDESTFEIRDQAPPVPTVPQRSLPPILDANELAKQATPIAEGIVQAGERRCAKAPWPGA